MSSVDPMVIFTPGSCPDCGGQLIAIDMETTFMKLSDSGDPISEDTMVNCEAVCSRCKKRYSIMRDGLRYVRSNEYTRFLKNYFENEARKRAAQNIRNLSPSEDNPFCINTKGQS